MKLLHLFMFFLFVVGLLLIITTFTAYSKLDATCTSDSLRGKLRWAIGIGTTFVTLAIGYMVCIIKEGCKCDFGERSDWKIYTMLTVLMGMGGGLLALTIGIKNDVNSADCHIDLGGVPDILMALSIAQLVIPVLYIIYITVKGLPKGKTTKDEEDDKEDDEEDDDESLALEAESRREAIDSRRRSRYKKSIAKKEEELSSVLDKIEEARSRGKSNPKDKEKRDLLVKQLKEDNSELSEIGSSVSESDDSRSSGSSDPPWLT
jgi:hypothetical protein